LLMKQALQEAYEDLGLVSRVQWAGEQHQ
jgi:hypothetical protein